MNATVRTINREEAKPFITDVHYAHRMPPSQYLFGLDDGGALFGVVSFGPPASPQVRRSVLGETKWPMVELNRLVITTPTKNAASFLVGRALRLLPKPMVVVSYADGGMGHVGYVYQATNFYFCGPATAHDAEYIVDGVKVHPRTLAARGIKDPKRWAKENGIEVIPPCPKNRYVFLCGTATDVKRLTPDIKWPMTRDYPKGDSVRYDAPNQNKAPLTKLPGPG